MISFDYSWFLGKNLFNFVSLPWKLHNRYCHTGKLFQLLASKQKSHQSSPWKICVLPHSQQQLKKNSKAGRQFLDIKENLQSTSSSSFDAGYNVYVYDDDEGSFHEPKLDIQWGLSMMSKKERPHACSFSGWGQPLVIWQIHLCSCKSFAKIVPIQKSHSQIARP